MSGIIQANLSKESGLVSLSPGVAKAYCQITRLGLIEDNDYNVEGITATSLGNRTIIWDVDFSNVNYCVLTSQASTYTAFFEHAVFAVGSVRLECRNSANNAYQDTPSSTVAFGTNNV